MRFLNCEKVLIIALNLANVNPNKIAKIVNSFRHNLSIGDILNRYATCVNVRTVLEHFRLKYDPNRDKPTSRNAVLKVIEKWFKHSTIENFTRKNYRTAISEDRIKFLCAFVSKNNKNRKLTLWNLKMLLNLPCSLATISNYLKKNDLKCHVQRTKLLLNQTHKMNRLQFALEHLTKPIDLWRKASLVEVNHSIRMVRFEY